ncbi:MAG TPA: hypothetical protein VLB50_11065 [Ignavibacteriaceae bacterium]|nr:hypothetical protein [Ignavibacteriaceae bacterium]
MYFDEEDKRIIGKIADGKITDIESFILECCSYIRVRYKINHFWYFNVVFNTEEIIVPVDENRFFEKIKKFTNLLDYLEDKNFINVNKEAVALNSILPIFRENGSPFDEVLVLVYKYQGRKILASRELSLILRMKPRNIAV